MFLEPFGKEHDIWEIFVLDIEVEMQIWGLPISEITIWENPAAYFFFILNIVIVQCMHIKISNFHCSVD